MPGPLGNRKAKATIGRLRHRVRVEAATETLDSFRTPVPGWAAEATVWAEVDLSGGEELTRSGGQQARIAGTVLMRSRAGLTPKKRLVWVRGGGVETVLNVTACPPHEGGENFVLVRVTAEA